MERKTRWVAAAIVFAAAWVAVSQRPLIAQAGDGYGYYHQGKLISLKASPRLVAIQGADQGSLAFAAEAGLRVDSLAKASSFRAHRLTVYRVPSVNGAQAQSDSVIGAAAQRGVLVQPVFEAGMAVTIPSDEVIVGFKKATALSAAQRILSGYSNRLGITGVRSHRANAFIATISAPADGRAFGVSRALAKAPGIRFAEPNLVFTMARERETLSLPPSPSPASLEVVGALSGGGPRRHADPPSVIAAAPDWQTLINEGFEAAPSGWTSLKDPGAADAVPAITTARKRSGSRSVYMTGAGTQGAPPPGPYPNNALCGLQSPAINLAGAEEAYAECWFWAKYADLIVDRAEMSVFDAATSQTQRLEVLALEHTGDLTADPTAKAGWRRVLARIPPAFRKDGVFLRILFTSDGSNGAEGCYFDDVRVVATTDVDTQPLGNDTYGGRGYELQNVGQIAALGTDSNDLNAPEAWAIQNVSADVVVAVIDSGVDLSHPDLNLVTGYNADGTVGGGPVSDDDNRGTACAGNIGAKRDNASGTIGTAPGVKIMPIHYGTTLADLASAIDVAVAHGAKVLSNAWGFNDGTASQTVLDAIDAAIAASCIVVFAAGNGPDLPPYNYNVAWPGNTTGLRLILTVGATSPTDEHKGCASSDGLHFWGSSYVGEGPDVCAPGAWSYATDRAGEKGYNADGASGIDTAYTHDFGGTGSAAAKVAGIAALMCSKNPNLTPARLRIVLADSAKDIETAGFDDKTGYGRVDALAAVQAVPAITVIAPNGGEIFPLGTPTAITWSSSGFSGNVKIELSENGGTSYTTLFASVENNGSLIWNVSGNVSTQCRIRISQVTNPTASDASDADFSIDPEPEPTITVTSPNVGEFFTVGVARNITWNSSNVDGNVKIELSRDGGTEYSTLFASTPNDGSESWTPTGPDSNNCFIRISQVSDPAVNDTSDRKFSVFTNGSPSITVTSPNGGEVWQAGEVHNITWKSIGTTSDVKIEVSANGGSNYVHLFDSVPNDGSQAWTPVFARSSSYVIRITQLANPGAADVSDSTFTIKAPQIFLQEPNGGERWPVGSTQNIRWGGFDFDGNVNVELSRNGGTSFEMLFANTANDGSQAWTVTGPLSTNCLVRVSSVSTPAVTDTSAAAFTIAASPTATPTNLTATATSKSTIDLTWTDNAEGEDGYKLEYKVRNGDFQPFPNVLAADLESASISETLPGTTYSFRLRSFKGATHSEYSNVATVTTPGTAPPPPTNLTAQAKPGKKIALKWRDNSDGEEGFAIEIDDGTGWREVRVTRTNAKAITVTGLRPRKRYKFRVRAKFGDNYTEYSNEAEATAKR